MSDSGPMPKDLEQQALFCLAALFTAFTLTRKALIENDIDRAFDDAEMFLAEARRRGLVE